MADPHAQAVPAGSIRDALQAETGQGRPKERLGGMPTRTELNWRGMGRSRLQPVQLPIGVRLQDRHSNGVAQLPGFDRATLPGRVCHGRNLITEGCAKDFFGQIDGPRVYLQAIT